MGQNRESEGIVGQNRERGGDKRREMISREKERGEKGSGGDTRREKEMKGDGRGLKGREGKEREGKERAGEGSQG